MEITAVKSIKRRKVMDMKKKLRNGKWKFMLALPAVLALGIFAVGCRNSQPEDRALSITTYPAEFSIRAGGTGAITAVLTNGGDVTTGGVTWATNNPSAVTVDSQGRVTGVNPGFAVITATAREGGEQARTFVHVIADTEGFIPVTHVRLSTKETALNRGMTREMEARVYPQNATEQSVSWKSSNVHVATVDANGRVRALSMGTADITVITAEGGHEFTTRFRIIADNAEELVGIEIVQPPNNVFVPIGFNPPISGMIVEAVYSDNVRNPIPLGELEIEGFDGTIVEEWQSVKAKWGGFYDTWEVFVGRIPSSVRIHQMPANRFNVIRETMDLTGMVFQGNFGGSWETVPNERLVISFDVPFVTAGPKTVTIRYMNVPAVIPNDRNGIIYFGSALLRDFAVQMLGKTSTADAPIDIVFPAGISVTDLFMRYHDGTNTFNDPMGGLFVALNGNFVNLDLSQSNITDFPGSESAATVSFRSAATRWRNNIYRITFHPETLTIGAFAFFNGQLQELNLEGLSQLTIIGQRAFSNLLAMQSVNFTGTTSLESIGFESFVGSHDFPMLDLSTSTSLRMVGGWAFQGNQGIQFIEFPPNVLVLEDYAFDLMPNVRYVRFRSPAPRISLGWRGGFMATAQISNITPRVHRIWSMGDNWIPSSMHSTIFFVPRTLSWSGFFGADYYHGGTRDSFLSHVITLPYSGNPNAVYDPVVDALRGEELLNWIEPNGIRGQATITIDTTTVQAAFKDGNHKVVANTGDTFTIPAGGGQHIIGVPAQGLQPAIPENVAEITGLISHAAMAHLGLPIQTVGPNVAGAVGWDWSSQVNPMPSGESGTPAAVDGRSGILGMPVIWPDLENTPSYIMLELRVYDGAGNHVGYLDRWARGSYLRTVGGDVVEEVRVSRWVYVDRWTTIFRYRMGHRQFVWLVLQQGWNLIDTIEGYFWDSANEAAVLTGTVAGRQHLSLSSMPTIMQSGGLIADNTSGRSSIHFPGDTSVNVLQVVPSKPIPWVVRSTDTWKQITQALRAADTSVNPPVLLDPATTDAPPPLPIGTPGGITGWANWMSLSREHVWRVDE